MLFRLFVVILFGRLWRFYSVVCSSSSNMLIKQFRLRFYGKRRIGLRADEHPPAVYKTVSAHIMQLLTDAGFTDLQIARKGGYTINFRIRKS